MNNEPKTFSDYYNLYCKESKKKSKIHLFDNNLEIIADRLENDDWKPILKALRAEANNLHCIVIRSKFLSNEHNQNLRHRITEPAFFNENLTQSVLEAIKISVIRSEIMCSICLEGVPLNNHIEILNDGIIAQKRLQHLALPYCRMTDYNLTLLCRSIYKHPGLQTLDLTGCGITNYGAKEISAVIRKQKLVRYGETWKQSLRYRSPQPDILPGLRRITLNNNDKIGDDGFKSIIYELMDDLWIKAVDFQNCGLTNSSIEDVLSLLKTNPIIKILDIRKNNIPSGIIKNITELLNKNANDSESYSWLNNSTLSTTITSYHDNKWKNNLTASRAYSCPNGRTNRNTYKPPKTTQCHGVQSNTVLSELKETKFMLRKVSTCLLEEKIKREAIEKEHSKFKQQIEEIRSCLKQRNKTQTTEKFGKTVTHSKSKVTSKQSSDQIVVGNKTGKNKNSVSINNKKSKEDLSNSSSGIEIRSQKSTKLLLMIPVAPTCDKHNKYINYTNKKFRRTISSNIKIIKHHTTQKMGIKSESYMSNKRNLKSTIALNSDV